MSAQPGWTSDPESAIRLDAKAPPEPGVYAFALDDGIYVGLTNDGLKARPDRYRAGATRARKPMPVRSA